MIMFIYFFHLWRLGLTIKLYFKISEVARSRAILSKVAMSLHNTNR